MTKRATLEPEFRHKRKYLSDSDLDTHYGAIQLRLADHEAVASLMGHFVVAIQKAEGSGSVINLSPRGKRIFAAWLGGAFEQVLCGKSTHEAFGLSVPANRPKGPGLLERDLILAAKVHAKAFRFVALDSPRKNEHRRKQKQKNMTITNALGDVINEMSEKVPGLAENQLARIYRRHRKKLDDLAENFHKDYMAIASTSYEEIIESLSAKKN